MVDEISAEQAKADAREKTMAELRAKFPEPHFELLQIDIRAGFFVLRNPSHQEHMMYKKMLMDDGQQHIAANNLFVSTCVYPDNAAVQAAVKRWPGILMHEKVQKAFRYLSGASDTLEGKG